MQLHLGGHLSWYDPDKRASFDLRLDGPMRLADLLERLGIPPAEVAVAAVNGTAVELAEAYITDRDRVDLLPPIGGGYRVLIN
ncbi:MAG: MoaD/ThiS family protein [Anaerolineae bacterium]